MAYVIEHKHPKDKALTMVKKALSGKFAIIKDEGFTLKAGAPMHPVTIEVTDTNVTVNGGGMAKMFVDPVGSEIKLYFEENQNVASNSGSSSNESGNGGYSTQEYFTFQEKGITILKSYKELLDNGIISEEEFDAKKTEILNSINGTKIQGSNNDAATVEEYSAPESETFVATQEEVCCVSTDSSTSANDDLSTQTMQDNKKNTKSIWLVLLWAFLGLTISACAVNIILSLALTKSLHGMFVKLLDGYLPGFICMSVGVIGFITSLCILLKNKEAKTSKITAIILLVAILCITFVPLTWYDYALWTKNPNDTYSLHDFDPKFVGDYTIPSSRNGIPVTSISDYAFYATNLTNITIPASVTSMGANAFSNSPNLRSVTILGNISSINSGAFNWCISLTNITMPNSITSIGGGAFCGCSSLTSITIPDSVTSIGGGAFEGCTGLTSITIPDSVTSIGGFAFDGCTGLTSITIPAGIQSIGNDAFRDCPNLTIKYSGTELQWHIITDGITHECNIIYNYTGE